MNRTSRAPTAIFLPPPPPPANRHRPSFRPPTLRLTDHLVRPVDSSYGVNGLGRGRFEDTGGRGRRLERLARARASKLRAAFFAVRLFVRQSITSERVDSTSLSPPPHPTVHTPPPPPQGPSSSAL
jgi:hypothetical protein